MTGGRGRFGSIVVELLASRGYHIVSIDRAPADAESADGDRIEQRTAELGNYAEVEQMLRGAEAVIHLAAVPNPRLLSAEETFVNNTATTYHVLEAAARLGMKEVVLASSESAYGFPWAYHPLTPSYVPVDEAHPLRPEDPYGLSKAVGEQIGESFHRRTGMQVVSLRLSTICAAADYAYLLQFRHDPTGLRRILWSYVDAGDAAEACVLAIEPLGLGAVSLNICADDTCSDWPTKQLVSEFLPGIDWANAALDRYRSLYSNEQAKKLLGWTPRVRWQGRP